MARPYRCLMIGAGRIASAWMGSFLPPFAGRITIAALVDHDEAALARGGDMLGLGPERRFTEMATAFANVDADCCIITVTPEAHEEAVLHAVERRLPILSEKPIADTWQSCRRIYAAVTAAGVPMQVVQNYRYTPPLLTMSKTLREGSLGRVNYVIARFADDYRELNSWGAPFRHQIPHALLVEGAVHHFDSIRMLSGGDCATIAGWEWNPAWSSSQGEFCNLYVMRMTNDTHATYEGNGTAAGRQNGWHHEAYRVECEDGAVAVGHDHVTRIYQHRRDGGLAIHEVPSVTPEHQGHRWVIDEFLDWLEGGPTPATELHDNIKSVAMVFGAIDAARTEQTVDVAAMIAELD